MGLKDKGCIPCRGGVDPLSPEDARILREEVPEWALNGDATRLSRTYRFMDFKSAMEFSIKVGELSEGQGHHPDISLGWGYSKVLFYTHKIEGLHENDFIMAAKVDSLYKVMAI